MSSGLSPLLIITRIALKLRIITPFSSYAKYFFVQNQLRLYYPFLTFYNLYLKIRKTQRDILTLFFYTTIDKNLLVNPEKTEEYSINRTSNQDWKNCKYLGSLLGDEEDIKRRKQLACDAFRKNKKCLTSKYIRLKIRLRIFEASTTSIFLYNAELWTLKYKQNVQIDTFQRSFFGPLIYYIQYISTNFFFYIGGGMN